MDSVAVSQMFEAGLARELSADDVDAFLAGDGLRVVLFSGLGGKRIEGHDVAVALRELLRDYGGAVSAGIVAASDERQLMGRFRVAVLPSLIFLAGGDVLEVMPRVRDWADYANAFQRFLGAPDTRANGVTA